MIRHLKSDRMPGTLYGTLHTLSHFILLITKWNGYYHHHHHHHYYYKKFNWEKLTNLLSHLPVVYEKLWFEPLIPNPFSFHYTTVWFMAKNHNSHRIFFFFWRGGMYLQTYKVNKALEKIFDLHVWGRSNISFRIPQCIGE